MGVFRRRKPKDAGRALREHAWNAFSRTQFFVYTFVLILLLVLTFLWPFMFIRVPTGYHGVMYRYFFGGTVTDRIWGEGLHVIPPWDTLTLYESRLIEKRIQYSVLSEEGLELGVEISIRFRPNKDMLGYLHQDIGPDYYERLIRPEVEAHVRKIFGGRSAHEIYSSAGDLLQQLRGISMLGRVDDSGDETTTKAYTQVQEVKLIDIDLPPIVERYIAERYQQEQLMLEYKYKLDRAEKEAERQRIEAAGIRDYNRIASTISHDLLRWRDIDATLKLSQSNNSKVVLLGSGAGDTPLIFNLGESPSGDGTGEQISSEDPEQQEPLTDDAAADAATSPELNPSRESLGSVRPSTSLPDLNARRTRSPLNAEVPTEGSSASSVTAQPGGD